MYSFAFLEQRLELTPPPPFLHLKTLKVSVNLLQVLMGPLPSPTPAPAFAPPPPPLCFFARASAAFSWSQRFFQPLNTTLQC